MDPLLKLRSLVRIRAQVEAGEFMWQLQQGQQHILAQCWMPDVQNPGVTGPTHSWGSSKESCLATLAAGSCLAILDIPGLWLYHPNLCLHLQLAFSCVSSHPKFKWSHFVILHLIASAKTPFSNKVAFIDLMVKTYTYLVGATIESTIEACPSPG